MGARGRVSGRACAKARSPTTAARSTHAPMRARCVALFIAAWCAPSHQGPDLRTHPASPATGDISEENASGVLGSALVDTASRRAIHEVLRPCSPRLALSRRL